MEKLQFRSQPFNSKWDFIAILIIFLYNCQTWPITTSLKSKLKEGGENTLNSGISCSNWSSFDSRVIFGTAPSRTTTRVFLPVEGDSKSSVTDNFLQQLGMVKQLHNRKYCTINKTFQKLLMVIPHSVIYLHIFITISQWSMGWAHKLISWCFNLCLQILDHSFMFYFHKF